MDVIIPDGFDELNETGKKDVIREMLSGLAAAGHIEAEDVENLTKSVLEREQQGSTGIIDGVGVPHTRHTCINKQICAIGRSKKGVNFESIDGNPTFVFFMILGPKSAAGEHLELLANISMLIRDAAFVRALKDAQDVAEMTEILNKV